MAFPTWIISASWLLFFAYWVIMAVGVKRSVSFHPWRNGGWLRVVVIVLVPSLIFRAPPSRQALRWVQQELAAGGMVLSFVGAALCALGIGFAIWARAYL